MQNILCTQCFIFSPGLLYIGYFMVSICTFGSMYMCHDCVCWVSQCLDLYLTFNEKPRENICTIGLLQ